MKHYIRKILLLLLLSSGIGIYSQRDGHVSFFSLASAYEDDDWGDGDDWWDDGWFGYDDGGYDDGGYDDGTGSYDDPIDLPEVDIAYDEGNNSWDDPWADLWNNFGNNTGNDGPDYGDNGNNSDDGSGANSNPEKTLDKRTDCGNGANTRSNNAKIILDKVSASYQSFMKLTSMATEYSARIDYNGSNYAITTLEQEGENSTSDTKIAVNTMYSLHTHTEDSEPPSPTDYCTLLDANKYFYIEAEPINTTGGYNLQGAIVINNNTEYLISIADRQQAYDFSISNNANIFAAYTGNDPNIVFDNSKLEDEFNIITENLFNQGYKDEQSNYAYVMSYLLDEYKTGLTISVLSRSDSSDSFKELKTNKNNNSYNPTICP